MASAQFSAALERLLELLGQYDGRPVVVGSDLHNAAKRLESFCRFRPFVRGGQCRLHAPAAQYWFRLLWASREDSPNFHPGGGGGCGGLTRDANAGLALQWAQLLRAELQNAEKLEYAAASFRRNALRLISERRVSA